MTRNTSNTGAKQAKKGRGSNLPEDGKETQFKKGYDPRRNMKGRPKAFDQWRELAQDVLQQVATNQVGKPLMWNGEEITFAEFVLLTWALDKKQQEKIIEAAFGKVPDGLDITSKGGKLKGYIIVSPDDWEKE